MRYVGGKARIAKEVSEVILSLASDRGSYYEPFVGGGAMMEKMAPRFQQSFIGDFSEDLILMWRNIHSGWRPELEISEDEYAALREAEPSALRGLVGFGGSFGGKWFGGYARGGIQSSGKPRNHQNESARSVCKTGELISGANIEFRAQSFVQWQPTAGSVVYCDPPYNETTGYSASGGFDSAYFWSVMDSWVELGANVFVSEYAAPEGWDCVWEKAVKQSLTTTKQGRPEAIERLFTKGEK